MSDPIRTMPAVYHHCEAIYKAMEDIAEEDEDGHLIYEGHLTKLFRLHNYSVPYYSAVMRHLKRMDCVRQLQRGGGGSASRWIMLQPPTPDLYDLSPGLKLTSSDAIQAQQIRDLNARLNEYDDRIKILEAKVG